MEQQMISPSEIQEIRSHTRTLVRELNLLSGNFEDSELNYTECHVLFELDKHGRLRLRELAEILLLDKSTLSKVTKKLIEQTLVTAIVNPVDRREKWLELTPKGKEKTNNNNASADSQVGATLALIPEAEIKTVNEGLKLYARALHKKRRQKNYQIRLIKPQDNAEIAHLIRSVMVEYGNVGEGYSINDADLNDMYGAYSQPRSVYYVITERARIVGGGGIGPLQGTEQEICELRKMYFQPEVRGFGLGRKLVELCLAAARRYQYGVCYLETVERMWQANLLYQKMGFQKLTCPKGNTGHGACETYYSMDL